jgi:hypothetical protein
MPGLGSQAVPPLAAPVPAGARALAIADIDGDGLCEILVGCGDGKVRAYK